MSLDISKLECVKRGASKIEAACPACRKAGNDRTGNHLVVFNTGAYGCTVDRSPAHSAQIYALVGSTVVGDMGEITPQSEPQIELPKIWPISLLDGLVHDDTYWHGRGISSDTLVPFRGGVATQHQMKGRYVFPIFNAQGEIIGFDGRRIDGKPEVKWKILGPSSRFVWGGLDDIESTRRAILVESIGDSLMLREHGVPDSLCLFGSHMSPAVLAALISMNPDRIIVSTNRDTKHTVGQDAAARIVGVLARFFSEERLSVVLPPYGVNDWGEATRDQIAAAFLT